MATVLEAETVYDAELPDRYEVVNGRVVEPTPMSAYASAVANRLHLRLAAFGEQSGTGQSLMDMYFRLPLPDDPKRTRKPDLAFVSVGRWAADRPVPYLGNPMDVVPDLMVEVVSPTDKAEAVLAKANDYLRAGAPLVWLVYPGLRIVHAYTGPTAIRVYADADELDGGDVLPGLRVPMTGLFPPRLGGPEVEEDE